MKHWLWIDLQMIMEVNGSSKKENLSCNYETRRWLKLVLLQIGETDKLDINTELDTGMS
jgi:hypothetical protein